ncbi:hypothetical protein ACOSQ4_012454 [Xanthoceras sorbifolium]
MSNLKFSSMIFVFLVSLSSFLLTFTSAADPTYVYHSCSDQNFTRNSTYQSNLNFLLSSLTSNANRSSNGFSNATAGQDPNRVYGLFQCRGDVTTSTCQDCVAFASREVTTTQRCPAQKGAVIWYDECLLRYSDSYIFSTAARNPGIFMYNTNNVTVDPSWSQALMLSLMNAAVILAANDTKKFATRKGNSATSRTIYTLVQCTQDLSYNDCSGCLLDAISGLQTERTGGRTLHPSCICRYELYPFYNESLTASPPPAPTPSPPSPVTRAKGKSHISSSTIIAIVAPITVAAVLLVAGYCFLTRRARKKYNTKEGEIARNEILSAETLQFDLGTIQAATNRFSTDNKLGSGGFGEVYKGVLPNGQEIAVKRLSRKSRQGTKEFKNEVVVVAKLQHRNLRILVYEFVPNKSLDYFLYGMDHLNNFP